MRSRIVRNLLCAAAALGIAGGVCACSSSTTTAPTGAATSTTLQSKRPASIPSGVANPQASIPTTSCTPQPTAPVTLTVVAPRTDGIFVGASDNGAIGVRFMPDHTVLFAIDVQGTSAQHLMKELTVDNIDNNHGDWQQVSYDSVGNFTLTVFGGQDYYSVRDYTSTGFTLRNQNNFDCPGGQVTVTNTTMHFFSS